MRKKTGEQENAFFCGICSSCGEIYEAQSGSDDLEGITFSCKKMLCRGRVTLEAKQQKKASSAKLSLTKVSPSDFPNGAGGVSGPRRYC